VCVVRLAAIGMMLRVTVVMNSTTPLALLTVVAVLTFLALTVHVVNSPTLLALVGFLHHI
jgi:hypothetical protein